MLSVIKIYIYINIKPVTHISLVFELTSLQLDFDIMIKKNKDGVGQALPVLK